MMPEHGARSIVRVAAWPVLLGVFCLVVFASGLTSHGLNNWQESQRALVAREMYERGAWIVPTVRGEPYIAKPPLMYWCQLTIGHARRAMGFAPFADETEVRLTVALAGTLGVLATWFVARRMLFDGRDGAADRDWIAGIAALGLASGVLYLRAARTGELDILLAPFVVLAIGAMHACWSGERLSSARRWGAIAVATVALVGAALTKGPPALLVPFVALVGGTAITLLARTDGRAPSRRWVMLGALIGGLALGAPSALNLESPVGLLGVVSFALFGAGIGAGLASMVSTGQARAWGRLIARAHPWIVFALPVAALWVWGRLVASEIGADALARLAGTELDNNLRILDPGSPVSDWGFFAYGVLPMSLATIGALVWIARDRPRLSSGAWTAVAWALLGLLCFSGLGKGVARYLMPLWPACAMLGALWLGALSAERGPAFRGAIVAVLVAAGLGQAVWYGAVRARFEGEQSPRALVAELNAIEPGLELHALNIVCPALDFYRGRSVGQWGSGGRARGGDLAEFARLVAESGRPCVLLVPEPLVDRKNGTGEIERLEAGGLRVERIDVESRFRWRSAGAWFVPLRVSPGGRSDGAGLP